MNLTAADIRESSKSHHSKRRALGLLSRYTVTLLVMLSVLLKNGVVQSFRVSYGRATKSSQLFSVGKLLSVNSRLQHYSSTSLSGSGTDSTDNSGLLKKRTSLLKRSVRKVAASPVVAPKLNLDAEMAESALADSMADYERTVSRIPTSIKAKKVDGEQSVEKKPSPVHQKKSKAPVQPSDSFNSNSVYTNAENEKSGAGKLESVDISNDGSPIIHQNIHENSQLTTSVTKMAFNSLEVSANTKRALSEVMNYK